jgi:hypothetical protein
LDILAVSSCGHTPLVVEGPEEGKDGGAVVMPTLADAGVAATGIDASSSDIDSTGTLWVYISVSGGFQPGMQPQATIDIGVWEMTTRQPAYSAQVMAGPVGAMVPIAEDPADPGLFHGRRDLFSADGGYTRVWEFSIERGPDHVRRVILLAPSWPSVLYTQQADGLVVHWAPNHEAGVWSSVLVERTAPAPAPPKDPYQTQPAPPSWSINSSSDDGDAGPFAIPPVVTGDSYLITVGRGHNYQFDWGHANLSVVGEASLFGP